MNKILYTSRNTDTIIVPAVRCSLSFLGEVHGLLSTQLIANLTLGCNGRSKFRPLLHINAKSPFLFCQDSSKQLLESSTCFWSIISKRTIIHFKNSFSIDKCSRKKKSLHVCFLVWPPLSGGQSVVLPRCLYEHLNPANQLMKVDFPGVVQIILIVPNFCFNSVFPHKKVSGRRSALQRQVCRFPVPYLSSTLHYAECQFWLAASCCRYTFASYFSAQFRTSSTVQACRILNFCKTENGSNFLKKLSTHRDIWMNEVQNQFFQN